MVRTEDVIVHDDTAVYLRVSTLKESQKDSPEHQRMLCEEKARQEELKIQYVYEDRDTGTTIMARPEIQKLIEDAKKGYFKTVLFASLSRFSRDTHDALTLKRTLVNALGVRLVSIEDGYDSAEKDDELVFTIISTVNQKLSEQISLSTRRGIRMSAKAGNFTGSHAPYGYNKMQVDGRKTLVPNPETAPIVQKIYDLYLNHKLGEKNIIKKLNEEGVPSAKGGKWGVTSVQRILTNEAYIGSNVFSKHETKKVYDDLSNMTNRRKKQVVRDKEKWERSVEKTHEPIIDEYVFERAQELRLLRGGGSRGGVRNRVNVFAGFIFCAECGCSLVSMKSATRKKQEYRYLVCSGRRRQGEAGCSNGRWIRYEEFRDSIINEISDKLKKAVDINKVVDEHSKTPVIKNLGYDKEQKKLKKSIDINRKLLFELRKDHKLGEIDEAQYKYEKGVLESAIENAQRQLTILESKHEQKVDLQQNIREMEEALEQLLTLGFDNVDETRLILMKLIDKIVVHEDGQVEIHTPLARLN